MVEEHLADGTRIAQLLASEIDGRTDGDLARVAVVDANPDVEPTADGAVAYRIDRDEETFAEVSVHPDRAHVEFRTGHEAAVETAADAGLAVRPEAVTPPRTLVFVEDGAAVKRAADVVAAAIAPDDR